GFLRVDEGAIYFQGKEITRLAPWDIAALGLGRVFQDVRLFGRLTVLQNVMAGFKGQAGESVSAAVFRRARIAQQAKDLAKKARELLAMVGMEEFENALADSLSFGQQKLVAIARTLANESDVLLLDEPTAGISGTTIRRILNVMREITERGKTIVVIEHNM